MFFLTEEEDEPTGDEHLSHMEASPTSMTDFCEALGRDLLQDIDAWTDFFAYGERESEPIYAQIHAEKREVLRKKIDRLAELIADRRSSILF